MTALTARRITAVIRELFPDISPLTTHRELSGEGMLLGFTVTMPVRVAGHWGLLGGRWTPASEYLTRHLGTPVHVADVTLGAYRAAGRLAYLTIRTGA